MGINTSISPESPVLVVLAMIISGLAGAREVGVGVVATDVAVLPGMGVVVDVVVLQARETTRVKVRNITKLVSFNVFNCQTPFE